MRSKKWFVDFLFYSSVVGLVLAFTLMIAGAVMASNSNEILKMKRRQSKHDPITEGTVKSNFREDGTPLSDIIALNKYDESSAEDWFSKLSISKVGSSDDDWFSKLSISKDGSSDNELFSKLSTSNEASRRASLKSSVSTSYGVALQLENTKLNAMQSRLKAMQKNNAFLSKVMMNDEVIDANNVYVVDQKIRNADIAMMEKTISVQETAIMNLKQDTE